MTTASNRTSFPTTSSQTGQQPIGSICVSRRRLPSMATGQIELLLEDPRRAHSAHVDRTNLDPSEEAVKASNTAAGGPLSHTAGAASECGSGRSSPSLPSPPSWEAAPAGAFAPQLSKATPLTLVVGPSGTTQTLYDERLDLSALGPLTIERASHVEPTPDGRWTADLCPVSGPVLGPFRLRSESLAAEVAWIQTHVLT